MQDMTDAQRVDIEEWKREFFSTEKSPGPRDSGDEAGPTKKEGTFLEQRMSEDIRTLELMSPDAFSRIPMIYEGKDSRLIDESWREYRGHLTLDYLKKFKQASRRLKKQKSTVA